MAYYISDQEVRDKLGNTISSNFSSSIIGNSIAYGCSTVDEETTIDWADGMKYFGRAKGLALSLAAAFCHSTQINVSIQQLREWQMAMDELKAMYTKLLNEGLLKVGKSMFVTDEYQSDVLNPTTGTRVTGLHGIVPSKRLLRDDWMYFPY